ncbi:hypothetical protein ACFX2J_019810 [Malus domestica]
MDTHSSGEDFLVKARKPYSTTKQRERWTEGEHNKFLEALKLYGRAWQRIEERINAASIYPSATAAYLQGMHIDFTSHIVKVFLALKAVGAEYGKRFLRLLDLLDLSRFMWSRVILGLYIVIDFNLIPWWV